jgi:UPF0716 protein FxsA
MNLFTTLLLLFTVIPLVELFLLISIGTYIGVWNTILLVVTTALIGAWLTRRQGMSVLIKIRHTISEGKIPAEEFIDGFFILFAGILLITPGIITDLLGVLLLLPTFRSFLKVHFKKKLQEWINRSGGSSVL